MFDLTIIGFMIVMCVGEIDEEAFCFVHSMGFTTPETCDYYLAHYEYQYGQEFGLVDGRCVPAIHIDPDSLPELPPEYTELE